MPNRLKKADYLDSLEKSEAILSAILAGEKPRLDPACPKTGWIYDQLTRLNARFLLLEEAKCYVTLPHETEEHVALKGDTAIQAVGYPLTKSSAALTLQLAEGGLNNVAILGFLPQHRTTNIRPSVTTESYAATVLTKSDVHGLWQTVSLMLDRARKEAATDAPVIINTHDNVWQPLVSQYYLSSEDRFDQGIHLARSYEDVAQKIKTTSSPTLAKLSPRHRMPRTVKSGATILVQTSNDKKIHEFRGILQSLGVKAEVLPFNIIVDKPLEAKELSGTYSGNCLEKKVNSDAKTDALPRTEIEERLHAYGADPANTFVLWDDRGLEVLLDLTGQEEFERCSQYLNPYRRGPGVELANFLKAMSLTDMYKAFEAVAERQGVDKVEAYDITCYMLSDLFPQQNGERRLFTSFGATLDRVNFTPRPANDRHVYSEHFLSPISDPKGRTKAEIPNFIEHRSCMARAGRALLTMVGLIDRPVTELECKSSFDAHAGAIQRWYEYDVASFTTLFRDVFGHGSRGITKGLAQHFRFLSGVNGDYDFRSTSAYTVTKDRGRTKKIVHSRLNAFQTYQDDADAFVFGDLPGRMQGTDDAKIDQLFAFTSLGVGKQVYDPSVYSKFWGIYGSDWNDCIDIFDDFHRMGLIGQKPEHVFTRVESGSKRSMVRDITLRLDRAFRTYRRLNYSKPHYVEKGKEPEGLYRVTIYCSATSTDKVLRRDAFNLAYQLAGGGYAVKNGGGTEGLMVETSNGVHQFRRDAAANGMRQVPVNAIISDQYEYTRRAEGLCDWNDVVRVHPTIYQRLEKLQDTDAEIVLAGGMGTIQEIVGSLRTRMDGTRPVKNRPLVIVNQKVGLKDSERGVYDKLLKFLPQKVMQQCNVHVVDTVEQALSIVAESRRAMGIQPTYRTIANDTAAMPAAELRTA